MERRESSRPPEWWFESLLTKAHRRQQLLLDAVSVLLAVLANHNIGVFLTGGTLLGAVRHGGFVPHDDDLDLGCFSDDIDRIEALVRERGEWEWRGNCLWEGLQFASIAIYPDTPDEVGIDLWHRERDGKSVDSRPNSLASCCRSNSCRFAAGFLRLRVWRTIISRGCIRVGKENASCGRITTHLASTLCGAWRCQSTWRKSVSCEVANRSYLRWRQSTRARLRLIAPQRNFCPQTIPPAACSDNNSERLNRINCQEKTQGRSLRMLAWALMLLVSTGHCGEFGGRGHSNAFVFGDGFPSNDVSHVVVSHGGSCAPAVLQRIFLVLLQNGAQGDNVITVVDLASSSVVLRQNVSSYLFSAGANKVHDAAIFLMDSGDIYRVQQQSPGNWSVLHSTVMAGDDDGPYVTTALGYYDEMLYAYVHNSFYKVDPVTLNVNASIWVSPNNFGSVMPSFFNGTSYWWNGPCSLSTVDPTFTSQGPSLTTHCEGIDNSGNMYSNNVVMQFSPDQNWAIFPFIAEAAVILGQRSFGNAFLVVKPASLTDPQKFQNPFSVILGHSSSPAISNTTICAVSSQVSGFSNLMQCGPITVVDKSQMAKIAPFAFPIPGVAPMWKPNWTVVTGLVTDCSIYGPDFDQFTNSPMIINDEFVAVGLGRHSASNASNTWYHCSFRIYNIHNGGLVYDSGLLPGCADDVPLTASLSLDGAKIMILYTTQTGTHIFHVPTASSAPDLPPDPPAYPPAGHVPFGYAPSEPDRSLDSLTVFGRDSTNSNYYPKSFSTVTLQLAQNWTVGGGDLTSAFVVSQNRICFASSSMSCFSLRSSGKSLLYTASASNDCLTFGMTSITYNSDDDVYVVVQNADRNSENGQPNVLTAFHGGNGSIVYQTPFDSPASAPSISLGAITLVPGVRTVYMYRNGVLFADPETFEGDAFSGPVIGQDSVAFVSTSVQLYKLQLPAANILWKARLQYGDSDFSPPQVFLCDSDVVFTSNGFAFDVATGRLLWNNSMFYGPVAVDCAKGVFYAFEQTYGQPENSTISAFDIHTGNIRWSVPNPYGCGCLTLVEDVIYNVGQGGKLQALSKHDGTYLWKSDIVVAARDNEGGMREVTMVAADGRLVICSTTDSYGLGQTQLFVFEPPSPFMITNKSTIRVVD